MPNPKVTKPSNLPATPIADHVEDTPPPVRGATERNQWVAQQDALAGVVPVYAPITLATVVDRGAIAPLVIHQTGEYGSRAFLVHLEWEPDTFSSALGFPDPVDPTDPETVLNPVLVIDDVPENAGWRGLRLHPRETIPGLFASSLDHLSNKYFTQDSPLAIGDTATDLQVVRLPPKLVYPGPPGYLHTRDNRTLLTPGQHQLVLDAIRYDKPQPHPGAFNPGATLTALFSRPELEGSQQGSIAYTSTSLSPRDDSE